MFNRKNGKIVQITHPLETYTRQDLIDAMNDQLILKYPKYSRGHLEQLTNQNLHRIFRIIGWPHAAPESRREMIHELLRIQATDHLAQVEADIPFLRNLPYFTGAKSEPRDTRIVLKEYQAYVRLRELLGDELTVIEKYLVIRLNPFILI